jgi:acyl-lipid omega-6 desaturase (Delta-12 desaturase)
VRGQNNQLRNLVASFQTPSLGRGLLQIATSFGGFFTVCAAMYFVMDFSYLITLALAPIAAGFLVRIFIIQHDCGHLSFFRTRFLNNATGFACSLLTLAPYASWSRQHAGHHVMWNNLDRRQSGSDIYSSCLTVSEYRALSSWGRRWCRILRHPVTANILLPPLIFMILYRLPFDMPKSWRRERVAVQVTNLALVAVLAGLGLMLGFGRITAVQLPVMTVAAIIGVWLFSVQHRGGKTQWLRNDQWNRDTVAFETSTYLRLPRLLQWFTGNIGFHHIHHLNSAIPNYRLADCHQSVEPFRAAETLSFWDGFRTLRCVLWDEERNRMVTCREATIGHSVQ